MLSYENIVDGFYKYTCKSSGNSVSDSLTIKYSEIYPSYSKLRKRGNEKLAANKSNDKNLSMEERKERIEDILSLIILLENDSELPEIYRKIIKIIHEMLREILMM